MRCSAGLQRLARLALSAPHTHGWAAPLAEAASAAGAQGALAPGAAWAIAGRRYLWQDGRLAHGVPWRGASLVPKGAWRLAGCVLVIACVNGTLLTYPQKSPALSLVFHLCFLLGALQLARHMAKVA